MSAALPWLGLAVLLAAVPWRAEGIDRLHRSSFDDFVCQNGVEEESEQCDDGDGDDRDGCTSTCRLGAVCDDSAFPGGDRFVVDPASGHCYVAFEDQANSFEAASHACLVQVSHLASLTSAAEEALVRPLQAAGQRPWIGAADLTQGGTFAWLSGEPFVHQHFIPGQPDADGRCLHLGNAAGEWNDTACGGGGVVTGWLCEREP